MTLDFQAGNAYVPGYEDHVMAVSMKHSEPISDLIFEIPIRAWVSAQVIENARRHGSLKEATQAIEKERNLVPGTFSVKNLARLAALLHCIVVVPVKTWLAEPARVEALPLRWEDLGRIVSLAVQPAGFDGSPVYHFLWHLAEAVAEIRYWPDGSGGLTFHDVAPDGREIFRATIPFARMDEFLQLVAPALVNPRASSRTGNGAQT